MVYIFTMGVPGVLDNRTFQLSRLVVVISC